jgi:hypothetical protein
LAIDFLYPRRAVNAFIDAANSNCVGPRHVSNVIRYDKVDVSSIEPFLQHKDSWIRKCAAQIISARGNVRLVIAAAKIEEEKSVLLAMIESLSQHREGLEEIINLLESNDKAIRSEVIQMFRRAGRAECLFGLAFSDDDDLVSRVKRYMEEQDGRQEKNTNT